VKNKLFQTDIKYINFLGKHVLLVNETSLLIYDLLCLSAFDIKELT
jgi:hypothetical protein